ncbi:MAG: hypothetical protein AAGB12_08140 [Pseudomonadota bacterium]
MLDNFNHKALLVFILLFTTPLEARFYPPQLEPIQVMGKTSSSIGGDASLAIDDRQKLCIAENYQGLYCYDGTYLEQLANNVLGLAAIAEGATRKLFFSSENILYYLHQGEIFLSELQIDFNERELITDFYEIDSTSFFISTTKGVYLYEYGLQTLKKIHEYREDIYVYFIKRLKNSSIAIATSNGLLTVDLMSRKIERKWEKTKVYYIYNNYYLTSQGVFDEDTLISQKIFYHAAASTANSTLLSGPDGLCYLKQSVFCPNKNINGKVYRTLTDAFSNIWVSTSKGLMFSPFSHVEYMDENTGLSNTDVIALAHHQHTVYIGTSSGVNTLDVNTGKIETIHLTQPYRITALLYVDGYLWIGTHKQGVFRYDLNEKQQETPMINNTLVVKMIEYQGQIVAASYEKGLFVFDREGFLVKNNIEIYNHKILTLFNCNDNLYISSIFQGIRRLDSQFKASHYTNKMDLSIFACQNDELATAVNANELHFFQPDLFTAHKHHVASDINSLVYQDDRLWVLHKNAISQWVNQRKTHQYLANLDTLYNNSVITVNDQIFAGSPIGLAIIDLTAMVAYQPPESEILLTTSTDNLTGSLTIEPRLNNLAASFHHHDILYRTTNSDTFTPIKHGQSLVFPEGLPTTMHVEFKGIRGVKKITAPLMYENKKSESFSFSKPITFPFYYIAITIFLLMTIQFFIAVYLRKVSVTSNLLDEKNNDKEEMLECIFDDFETCADILERLKKAKKHDENIRLLLKLNALVCKNEDVSQAKTLANELNVDTKKIERMLRKLFGSGSIIKYQQFYLEYSMIKQDTLTVERFLNPENQI